MVILQEKETSRFPEGEPALGGYFSLAHLIQANWQGGTQFSGLPMSSTINPSTDNANVASALAVVQPTPLYLPTDGQWHLQSTGSYDINISGAWQDYTGRGITVGIVDSGIQYTHPELSARYNAAIDYDFLLNKADGSNKQPGDNHGTAVAGVIAAANDSTGSTG